MAEVSKGGANGQPWWDRSSNDRGHVHILDLFQATLAKADTTRMTKLNAELTQASSFAWTLGWDQLCLTHQNKRASEASVALCACDAPRRLIPFLVPCELAMQTLVAEMTLSLRRSFSFKLPLFSLSTWKFEQQGDLLDSPNQKFTKKSIMSECHGNMNSNGSTTQKYKSKE